jgi:hypothetical protein
MIPFLNHGGETELTGVDDSYESFQLRQNHKDRLQNQVSRYPYLLENVHGEVGPFVHDCGHM